MVGQSMGGFGSQIAVRNLLEAKLESLSFSREQEYEADSFGLRYMLAAGYDPAGAAQLLGSLAQATALEARVQGRTNRRIPEWASTHPLSENRMQRALQEGRATGRIGTGVRNRDQFLSEIEGLYVDDDPAQGIIDGPVFTHPDLRIQFQVPTGYLMSNGTYAVTIAGSAGKAQFSGGRATGSLDNYVVRVFQRLIRGQGQIAVPSPRRLTINGLPAALRPRTSTLIQERSMSASSPINGILAHLPFRDADAGRDGDGSVHADGQSLRKISASEAAAIRPRVIHVETVKQGDTLQSLATRMAYRNFQLDRFCAQRTDSTKHPRARAEGEARRLWVAARRARRFLHVGFHRRLDLAPHAAGTSSKRLQPGHHRNDDEAQNEPIFDSSSSTLARPKHAQSFTDSDHATLLWSTSTRRV